MSAVFSERLGHDVHFGKLPASKPQGVPWVDLRRSLQRASVLPKIPDVFGHGNDFAGGNWLMLANGPDTTVRAQWTAARQGCGNCVVADRMHDFMESARDANRPIPRFNGDLAVIVYGDIAEANGQPRYNPLTGENDNGLDMHWAIAYAQQHGIPDLSGTLHHLGQAIDLDPGNLQHIWEAAYLVEAVDIGVQITQANMDQFDAGLPFDYVPGSPDLGGHAIPDVGRPRAGSNAFLTWARREEGTDAFLENQMDEAHAVVDPLRYNRVTGQTAEHYKDQDIEKFIVLLAQRKLGQR